MELRSFAFPSDAPNDARNLVVDSLVRWETFLHPVPWVQIAAGLDLRANTHDQVSGSWRLDFADRSSRRSRVSMRRLNATLNRGPVTIDVGKQFVRWGKTDVLSPTDRFAARDYTNVIDNEFLAVSGARVVYESSGSTIDFIWAPALTPSRLPRLDQRWAPYSPYGPSRGRIVKHDFPARPQIGVRWGRFGSTLEYSISFFDGSNHLPTIDALSVVGGGPLATADLMPVQRDGLPIEYEVALRHLPMRMYGGDTAFPVAWFTLKGEAAYFTSSSSATEEYAIYVLQVERQIGDWLVIGGYAGEIATAGHTVQAFSPERGATRSVVGRASYAIEPNRSVAVEGVLHQNGDGAYLKGEFSQAAGNHWRITVAGAAISGKPQTFLGQFRHNSYFTAGVRYSF